MSDYNYFAWTLALSLCGGMLSASEIEGFTEPYRDLDVAVSDTGIVATIDVKEGDHVLKDQILGTLDQKLLNATLEIAEKSRTAKGRIQSAQADIRLKSERAEKLLQLLSRKHASQEEIDRGLVEKEVAEAQLLAVEEDLAVRSLECERIKIQIEQRIVRSPIDGVVVKLHRDVGEFVSGSDPVVATVVQLDPLIATYSIPSIFMKDIQSNQEVSILIGEGRGPAKGTVDYIAPVTDAQSGTIQVKVKVANPKNSFRSGEKCLLVVKGDIPKTETASQPTAPAGVAPKTAPRGPAVPTRAPGSVPTSSPQPNAASSIKTTMQNIGRMQ